MSKSIQQDRKASITITFATPASALEWFEEARELGLLQEEAALFEKDQLDETVSAGAPPSSNEFIVRKAGSRAYQVTAETVITTQVVKADTGWGDWAL